MARLIYCYECAPPALSQASHMPRADKLAGWLTRWQFGKARCPADHGLSVTTAERATFEPLTVLHCDLCNAAIPDSALVLGVTEWRGPEPYKWEPEYMDVITEEEWRRISARLSLVRKRLDGGTLILDDFKRAKEGPPPSASWTTAEKKQKSRNAKD